MVQEHKRYKRNKNGFTLVEMLFYIALMTIITLSVSQSLVAVLKSDKVSFAENNIRNSGYSAMEAMLREIHASKSIDQVDDGILQMKQNSGTNVIRFATSSDLVLGLYEGLTTPTFIGPLTSKNILVKNLIFSKIDTGKSLAVRIQMQLEATINGQARDEWFYGTAILRGSY